MYCPDCGRANPPGAGWCGLLHLLRVVDEQQPEHSKGGAPTGGKRASNTAGKLG